MPMENSFNPDHPLPLFLADRPEGQSIGIACDRAVISSRVFKASILVAAATATGIVVLSVGDHPRTLFADVTALLVGNLGLQPDTDHLDDAPPALRQSTADAQAAPPAAKDAPPGDEIASSEPAEKSEPSSEVMFRQFQAWVAEQNAHANVRPAQPAHTPAQIAQNAPARVAENASVAHLQKHRHVLPVHDARAEIRTQNVNKVRRSQSARQERPPAQSVRVERPPVEDALAQSEPMQDTQVSAAAAGAAAYGAYGYYGGYNNGCYRDGYGRWVCQQY